ncbi:pirin family protein [Sediminibacterium soli]|uniref:pirin family protein n=1 Tax=Sediminibacterium soli TaxID=2698829 RepID=UPI00137AC403|nr:pirin family protein [Sediminibacterium soli]NCI46805.1 pirin family protein [Sediminibacterium soli]
MEKAILHILAGREKKITEDETVRQPLPHKDFRFANPFIVLHHIGPEYIKPGATMRIHPHPHRGFSPYTFMLQGEGFHRDNAGNNEIIGAGGVQWMFAGRGILHSEGPTPRLLHNGGIQEMVQLWINAPRSEKWGKPFYQSASQEQLPLAIEKDGIRFRLASGDYNGFSGPIRHFTPVISMTGEVEAGRTLTLNATPGYWALLYVIRGEIVIGEQQVAQYHLVVFENEHDTITLTAGKDSQLMFLSAEPLDEPVAAKDNFVMNTAEEIEQAISDYRQGLFGTLSS